MEWLLYFMIAVSILMKCYLIFTAGRIFENIVGIRKLSKEIDEDIDKLKEKETVGDAE